MYNYRNPQFLPYGTPVDLSGANSAEYVILNDLSAVCLCAITTNVSVSTGSIVVTYSYRPVLGSASGAVVLGTVTIPAGTAAGKVLKNYIKGVECLSGGSIIATVSTAASTSGAAQLFALTNDNPESDLNQPNVILVSA